MITVEVDKRYSMRRKSDGQYALTDDDSSFVTHIVAHTARPVHCWPTPEAARASLKDTLTEPISPGPQFRGMVRRKVDLNDYETVEWSVTTIVGYPDWDGEA